MNAQDLLLIIAFGVVGVSLWRVFRRDDETPAPSLGVADGGKRLRTRLFGRESSEPEDASALPKNPAENTIEYKVGRLSKYDRKFDPQEFLREAANAFRSVLASLEKRDMQALRQGMSERVYRALKQDLAEQDKKRQRVSTELVRIKRIGICDAGVEKRGESRMAFVKVIFESEQISLLKDRAGKVIAGNDNQLENVVDVWRFVKPLGWRTHGLWLLDETEMAEEAGGGTGRARNQGKGEKECRPIST